MKTVLRGFILRIRVWISRRSKLRRAHCRIKMVDGTDNQKKVEKTEKETALCFTRYTQANILRISSSTSCLERVFASKSAVIKIFQIFFMTDNDNNDDRQNRLLNPACAYARGVITLYSLIVGS